jgi:serine/threonine protein kinase
LKELGSGSFGSAF